MNKWYMSNTGNHQGLVIDQQTGETIAVTYKKENAALIAAAPYLLEACLYVLENLDEANIKKLIKAPKNFMAQLNESRKLLRYALCECNSPLTIENSPIPLI